MKLSGERIVGSDRVLSILIELGNNPDGISLDELARTVSSSKPTVHRALATLQRHGLARKEGVGHYALGDEFLRIAFAHHDARPDHIRVAPALKSICDRLGETVHYAVLEGREIIYRSKVDPVAGAVRLTSTVGGRGPAHATAVGKMLLALQLQSRADLLNWIGDTPLDRRTPQSLTTVDELMAEFARIRNQGYAVDDQENEHGINCVAIPLYLSSPTIPSGALSVSAVAYRFPLENLVVEIPNILSAVAGMGLTR